MSPEGCAIALMASRAGKAASLWRPAGPLTPGVFYDWADPATGRVGQCWIGRDGDWVQAPLGGQPVVLEYLGRRARR